MQHYNPRISTIILFIYATHTAQSLESASLIGGKPPPVNEAKYLVSLQTENEHFCGGSIIGERFVLTAAHCVIEETDKFIEEVIHIVAGTSDLRSQDNSTVVVAEVEKIYVPAHYNDSEWMTATPSGDIAVLKLKQSFDLKNNTSLKRLRLPRANRRRRYKTYVGDDVLIAGFGWDKVKLKKQKNKTKVEVGSSSDRLSSATAKVISNAECRQYYSNPIRESELCARVSEHDDDTPQGVCRGDSGSPLVYKSSTIIGVVSGISMGCNENNEPGIYCRVSSYMKFIKNAIRDNTKNMRTKTY